MTSIPSPAVAAFLSFLFPGLGQLYAGARQRGLLLALPWLVLLLGIAFLVLTNGILGFVTDGETMVVVLVFVVAVFFYHVAAVLDAYAVAGREREACGLPTPRYGLAVVALLVAVLLVPYGVMEVYGIQFNDALEDIAPGNPSAIPEFEEDPTDPPGLPSPSPGPTGVPGSATPPGSRPSPTSPGSSPTTPTPMPPDFGPIDAPWAENGRLDLLLVGADAGRGRSSVRTDTMILLSVEIQTGKAAMFGFPRNMINVPLPRESAGARPNGIFDDMLSALWRRAAEEPGGFMGSEGIGSECQFEFDCERAWRALSGAIQNLAGVPIDGIIAVDMNGFASLVDAVNGVWVNVPTALIDEDYRTQDGRRIRVEFEPGCHHLDGTLALAYARSREQDSDYHRMRRQQQVLQAIRRQFDPLDLLPRTSELLSIARDNLFTTIDRDNIPLMAQVAERVDADRLHRIRFQKQSLRHVTPDSIRRIRARVGNIFSEPPPAPTPTPSGDRERCPPR